MYTAYLSLMTNCNDHFFKVTNIILKYNLLQFCPANREARNLNINCLNSTSYIIYGFEISNGFFLNNSQVQKKVWRLKTLPLIKVLHELSDLNLKPTSNSLHSSEFFKVFFRRLLQWNTVCSLHSGFIRRSGGSCLHFRSRDIQSK